MSELLKDDFEEFIEGYSRPCFRGLRLNPLKCGKEALLNALPFAVSPAPFSPLSYYIPNDVCKVGSLAMHHAGAFYVQEPSAAAAVTALAPMAGERVLDLCAAPGGKSTQIAALLSQNGLLWSNELVKSRANVLLSNIERMGVRNAVVSSCTPNVLCAALEGFFDRVLVDAPCSGEGMFRKDPQAVLEWSPEHVQSCAQRQLAILNCGAKALREGGTLVYSTCTFSVEENEGVIADFLKANTDFSLLTTGLECGRPALNGMARRIYPMDGGEGHFVAKLLRNSKSQCRAGTYRPMGCANKSEAECLYSDVFNNSIPDEPEQINGRILLLPKGLPELKGLGVLRAGVLLAEATQAGCLRPAHAAFMASTPQALRRVVSLSAGSPQMSAFLRGEELDASEDLKGWAGVAADGVITGFGKCSGGRLKNHYPKGLRANLTL